MSEDPKTIEMLTSALIRAAMESLNNLKCDGRHTLWIGPGRQFSTEQEWIDATVETWMAPISDTGPKIDRIPLPQKRVRFLDTNGQWREGEIVSADPASRMYKIRHMTVTGPQVVEVDEMRCQVK